VAPIEASSGKITTYRLNRGGDRQGNRALYLLAVGRMGWNPAIRAYVERRTAEGRTKPEIIAASSGTSSWSTGVMTSAVCSGTTTVERQSAAPPSTVSMEPVNIAASVLTTNSAARATSSGVTSRPIGVARSRRS
jgi:Transposase IS116/IS110/IS902 family